MSINTSPDAIAPAGRDTNTDFNIFDVLIVLARRKRLLILFPLAVSIIAALMSMTIPNVYTGSTKILPPQQSQSGAAALLSQLGGIAAAAGGGMKNPNELYIGMLKSRTIADRLIKRFQLQQVYGTATQEKTRRALALNTSIDTGKDGLIVIEVEDTDARRAAQLTNAYTEELLRLTKGMALSEAAQRRVFFERQLSQSKDNLANAEASLKGALSTRGVISVDAESRAIVETVAKLKAQIAAKVIEIESMRAFVTTNNQEYKRNEQSLISMRGELDKLENGRPNTPANTSGSRVGLENIKVLREVQYHTMLYELLAKQYEIARLDEAKDSSIIQVLDEAIEPEKHSKPKRLIIVIVFGIAAFLLAVGWALVAAAFAKASADQHNAPRLSELRQHLRLFGKRPARS